MELWSQVCDPLGNAFLSTLVCAIPLIAPFGSQQRITANNLGLSPELMAAANSSGGVMRKAIDARSIVVASVATDYVGNEGVILRCVFWHCLALASLIGLFVTLQAYVWPCTGTVVRAAH